MPTSRARLVCDQLLPLAVLFALAAWYLYTVPLTWISHDGLFDWAHALRLNAAGRIAQHGTNIVGAGFNGPVLFWLYQTALGIAPSEATMPWVSSVLAVIALAWSVWLLWPRRFDGGMLWRVALVASCPSIFEWTRLGFDYAFLPIFAPIFLLLRQRVHASGPLWLWPVAGLAMGVALQSYIIFLPLLGLLGAEFAWRAAIPITQGQARVVPRIMERWLLLVVGFAIPYLPLLLGHGLPIAPRNYGSWAETAATVYALLAAHPEQLALRLGQDAPALVRTGVYVLGWATTCAPLAALLLWRRLTAWERILTIGALATYALISYPDRVHYHNFVHLHVAIFASLVLLGRALAADRTRGAIAVAVILHVAFLAIAQRSAATTGFVTLANTFPTALAGETDLQATLRTRQLLEPVLRAHGICDQQARRIHVRGNRIVPFWEVAWKFLSDGSKPCTAQPARALRLGTCRSVVPGTTYLASTLCLAPAPAAPQVWVLENPDAATRTPLQESAAYKSSMRYEPDAPQQLLVVQLDAPGTLVVLAGRPTYVLPNWHEPVLETVPTLTLRYETRGYVVLQRAYAVPNTAPLELRLRTPVWDMYAEPAS